MAWHQYEQNPKWGINNRFEINRTNLRFVTCSCGYSTQTRCMFVLCTRSFEGGAVGVNWVYYAWEGVSDRRHPSIHLLLLLPIPTKPYDYYRGTILFDANSHLVSRRFKLSPRLSLSTKSKVTNSIQITTSLLPFFSSSIHLLRLTVYQPTPFSSPLQLAIPSASKLVEMPSFDDCVEPTDIWWHNRACHN